MINDLLNITCVIVCYMKQYLRFDVSVEDFSIMYMLQRQTNLHKPIQDLDEGEDGKW